MVLNNKKLWVIRENNTTIRHLLCNYIAWCFGWNFQKYWSWDFFHNSSWHINFYNCDFTAHKIVIYPNLEGKFQNHLCTFYMQFNLLLVRFLYFILALVTLNFQHQTILLAAACSVNTDIWFITAGQTQPSCQVRVVGY